MKKLNSINMDETVYNQMKEQHDRAYERNVKELKRKT